MKQLLRSLVWMYVILSVPAALMALYTGVSQGRWLSAIVGAALLFGQLRAVKYLGVWK